MPNISVNDQQALATAVQDRLQALDANTPNADLVYLARLIEIFNGNASLSAVAAEGDAQIARTISEGDAQSARTVSEGDTQIARVAAAGDAEAAELAGIQTQVQSALNSYKMSPSKVFFLSQS